MIQYRCTYCGRVETWTADQWQYHRATEPDHHGPARYTNDPNNPEPTSGPCTHHPPHTERERRAVHVPPLPCQLPAEPDRLTLADAAKLPAYVQRAIARTIAPELAAQDPEPIPARGPADRPSWSPTRDDAHPIAWCAADGSEAWYIPRAEALARLARYYRDPAEALRPGATIRTPFAYYTDTTEPEPEA